MIRMRTFLLVSVCLCAVSGKSDDVRRSLTTDDIANLLSAGFAEPVILHAIESRGAGGVDSPEALLRLRRAGAGDGILSAIKSAGHATTRHLPLLEPGVYAKRSDAYALVPAEPVQWRSSSSAAQGGGVRFTRVALVGQAETRNSPMVLRAPVELLIVLDRQSSAADYRILRADVKEDFREFRAEAALRDEELLGVGDSTTPAPAVQVDRRFDLGLRLFLYSAPKGEYGVLAPVTISGGRVIPAGVIYTFTID